MTLWIKQHLSASPQRVCVVSSTSERALCAGNKFMRRCSCLLAAHRMRTWRQIALITVGYIMSADHVSNVHSRCMLQVHSHALLTCTERQQWDRCTSPTSAHMCPSRHLPHDGPLHEITSATVSCTRSPLPQSHARDHLCHSLMHEITSATVSCRRHAWLHCRRGHQGPAGSRPGRALPGAGAAARPQGAPGLPGRVQPGGTGQQQCAATCCAGPVQVHPQVTTHGHSQRCIARRWPGAADGQVQQMRAVRMHAGSCRSYVRAGHSKTKTYCQ
jgi:hypothetical protein